MATFNFKKLETKLEKELKALATAKEVNVGFLSGATYSDGTPVAEVAALNEYGREVKSKQGNYYQLPRPFFRNCIAKNSKSWGEGLGRLLVKEKYDARKALSYLGFQASGDLVQEIQEFTTPPLAESTVKAKGFPKPLIDTGHMINSIDFEVKE